MEQRLCERFDDCNSFSAGLDVDDCTDTVSTEGGTPEGPGGGVPSPGSSGGAPGTTCGDVDVFTCEDANTISGCLDGEPFSLTCSTVCDGGPTDGCGFDDERGHDVCFCVVDTEDPQPEPPGPAPGG